MEPGLELKRHGEAFRSPREWAQRRGSVFEKHDFGGFDDGGNLVAFFQFHFVGGAFGDYALDEVFAGANDHVGHDAAKLDFYNFAFNAISG